MDNNVVNFRMETSVLPRIVENERGGVVEITVCNSLAGDKRESGGMPDDLHLVRYRGDKEICAKYILANIVYNKEVLDENGNV